MASRTSWTTRWMISTDDELDDDDLDDDELDDDLDDDLIDLDDEFDTEDEEKPHPAHPRKYED